MKNSQKVGGILISGLFLVFIFAFGVAGLFIKNKEISEKENRSLSPRPAMTFKSWIDGSYASGFDKYYSDNFPLRDLFLDINASVLSLYKRSDFDGYSLVQISGSGDLTGEALTDGDDPPEQTDSAVNEENQPLETETVKEEPAETETETETKTETEEAEEITPETVPAFAETQTAPPPKASLDIDENPDNYIEKNYILVSEPEKRAMEIYTNSNKNLISYARDINFLAKQLPNSRVFTILAPTSIEFYAPSSYNSKAGNSQIAGIETCYSELDGAIGVNVYHEIAAHADEYLYYRTDHHWSARGAYYAYRSFAVAAGFTPLELEDFESGKMEGFVGSFYRMTQNALLKNNPDTLEYFLPAVQTELTAYRDMSMEGARKGRVVAANVSGSNKYLAFISGDNPLTHIKTGTGNGKKIIVTKESFGNAFVPFLTAHYEQIYVVDPRKAENWSLTAFVKQNKIDDVLCINYMFATTNKLFRSRFADMIWGARIGERG